MRAGSVLVFLAGCDLVFPSLAPSGTLDAAPGDDASVDGGSDGPDPVHSCPTQGPPMFANNPVGTPRPRCIHYSSSAVTQRSYASCDGLIAEASTTDDNFTDATFAPPAALSRPRISPDGQELFAVLSPSDATPPTIRIYRFDAVEMQWVPSGSTGIPAPSGESVDFSAPSTAVGGNRSLVVSRLPAASTASVFEEWREINGSWTLVGNPYTTAMLGVKSMGQPNLSPDGTRLVFFGSRDGTSVHILYSTRSSPTASFGTASVIDTPSLTGPQHPFLRDDCGRLYVDNGGDALVHLDP